MMRTLIKGLGILFSVIVLFFGILFIAMSLFDSPTYAWRILRYGESDIADVFLIPLEPATASPAYIPRIVSSAR